MRIAFHGAAARLRFYTAKTLDVTTALVRDQVQIENAITSASAETRSGIIVLPDGLALVHRQFIVELAERNRVPTIYPFRAFPESGGLVSYGLDISEVFRLTAGFVDRILRGSKPADLAVEAPKKLELVINLRAAKAIGLAVSPMLVARADEVIE